MTSMFRRRTGLVWLLGLIAILSASVLRERPAPGAEPSAAVRETAPEFLIRKGDRVAWIGSSSTRIGVWPRTVEFLLRTRHPGLDLTFQRFTTGGGTFQTGLERLDAWLDEFRPTLVVFNYGGNDAGRGQEGLAAFERTMKACVARARDRGARVILSTPQAADVCKAGAAAPARRTLYAETMLDYGRARGWTVIDVHHPLDALQRIGEKDDPSYTILKDKIHLTDPAYIAWGYLFYDRLDLPFVRSAATLDASGEGKVSATEGCAIDSVRTGPGSIAFTRRDAVLPIFPPGPLPPRLAVPLESQSRYLLQVNGLEPGEYEIRCEDQLVGTIDAAALAVGINLNTLLLDDAREAPWSSLAQAIWDGKRLDEIGRTAWRFEVRRP